MTPLPTLQIVRRYGPVGGMERYVWELAGALAALGHPVTVLCERNHGGERPGITVHELGEIAQRPRWISLLRFSRRVTRWLRAHPQPGVLIHSHERVDVHQLTTFHGPPFATIFERGWWRLLSLRVWMQLYLERRELRAQAVVPNSQLIGDQLRHYYPQTVARLTAPVPPGVTPGPARETRVVPADGGVIGFVVAGERNTCAEQEIVSQIRQQPHIFDADKALVLVIAGNPLGEPDRESGLDPTVLHPCSHCRKLLQSQPQFTEDTIVASVNLDNTYREILLLGEILEMHKSCQT